VVIERIALALPLTDGNAAGLPVAKVAVLTFAAASMAAMSGCTPAARPATAIASPVQSWGAIIAEREPASKGPAAAAQPSLVDLGMTSTSARCPSEMALVDDRVCVDRWEAALVERRSDGSSPPWFFSSAIDGLEAQVRAISAPGVFPQGYISGKQAALACASSGKRLCTSREWERACRGPRNTTFPYGDARRPGACNDDIRPVHPVVEAAALMPLAGSIWQAGMNNALINQLADTLAKTGDRAECTNEYGVYDMVGNLHEWVDDPDGTFRGGYYMDTSKNGDGCSYSTVAHDFSYHDYSTGFRCCMDPDRIE
jgi:hypothetical protein